MKKFIYFIMLCLFFIGFIKINGSETEDIYLIPKTAIWKYQTAPSGDRWKQIDFDDSQWKSGKAGFGYGDNDDETLVNLRGKHISLGIRKNFILGTDPKNIDQLYLYTSYDDGFIAYLNGQQVYRVSMKSPTKAHDHEASGFEEFLISIKKGLLIKGKNLFAVHGFNKSLNSSDFSLHSYLTTQPVVPNILSRQEALSDLENLKNLFENRSSYYQQNKKRVLEEIEHFKASVKDEINIYEYGRNIQKIISLIGDCHGSLASDLDDNDGLYLPFALGIAEKGTVAIDGKEFLNKDYPYLTAIDGQPLNAWIKAASEHVAKCSDAFVHYYSLKTLRRVDILRKEMGLASSSQVKVTLSNMKDEEETTDLTLNLVASSTAIRNIPLKHSRIMDNIGYLRIAQMDNRQISSVYESMQRFKETEGLIIDVRGNNGGHYGILKALYGYFMKPNDPPFVTNFAAYRKHPSIPEGYLHYRDTYKLSWLGWKEDEKVAIQKALANFRPAWPLPIDTFSDWHFMVLRRQPHQYYYDKPVLVLSDHKCFSATDGFLSAFAAHPRVTLMGTPSRGGSGASRYFTLPITQFRIRLSTMASFQRSGEMFDGVGVNVDYLIKPKAENLLGRGDYVLDQALKKINEFF